MSLFHSYFKADQKILDVFVALCHKQQRFFGVTHYFWLKLDSLALAVILGIYVYPTATYNRLFLAASIAMLICGGLFLLDSWEKLSFKRLEEGLANPLRESAIGIVGRVISYFHICAFALMLLFALVKGDLRTVLFLSILTVFIIATFSLLIFPACDPLPPTKGKFWEWLSKKNDSAKLKYE